MRHPRRCDRGDVLRPRLMLFANSTLIGVFFLCPPGAQCEIDWWVGKWEPVRSRELKGSVALPTCAPLPAEAEATLSPQPTNIVDLSGPRLRDATACHEGNGRDRLEQFQRPLQVEGDTDREGWQSCRCRRCPGGCFPNDEPHCHAARGPTDVGRSASVVRPAHGPVVTNATGGRNPTTAAWWCAHSPGAGTAQGGGRCAPSPAACGPSPGVPFPATTGCGAHCLCGPIATGCCGGASDCCSRRRPAAASAEPRAAQPTPHWGRHATSVRPPLASLRRPAAPRTYSATPGCPASRQEGLHDGAAAFGGAAERNRRRVPAPRFGDGRPAPAPVWRVGSPSPAARSSAAARGGGAEAVAKEGPTSGQ